MGQIASVKCNMIHEGFATTHNGIRCQDELIHEHEFILTRLSKQAIGICFAANVIVIGATNYWKSKQVSE